MDESWSDRLRSQCAAAIEELASYAEADAEVQRADRPEPAEPPSLYAFFEELLSLRNEVRRGNRKVAETFGRFGDVLEGMRQDSGKLRERLGSGNGGTVGTVSRSLALALVDICDRVDRLEEAAVSQTDNRWLARLKAEGRWRKQAEAIGFLKGHLQPVLAAAGIHRIAVLGQAFDPLWMKALETDAPSEPDSSNRSGSLSALIVSEELLPGYRMGDQCLRPAEVRLSVMVSS